MIFVIFDVTIRLVYFGDGFDCYDFVRILNWARTIFSVHTRKVDG